MMNSSTKSLDSKFIDNVNKSENLGYSRAQSHMSYFMEEAFVQHEDKCSIYEKSHVNSVPMGLYRDVVDIESELINRTRKLSKCSSRHQRPGLNCITCDHSKKCQTTKCMSTDSSSTPPQCPRNIVRHEDIFTKYAPFKM